MVAGVEQTNGYKNPVEAVGRQARAIELRREGVGYAEIARQVGYTNPGTAYNAVAAGLRNLLREAGADELRALELDRLDRLQLSRWQRAMDGDDKALDRVLAIMKRRAELLGLDAPVTHRHAGHDGGPLLDLTSLSDDELHTLARISGAVFPHALLGDRAGG